MNAANASKLVLVFAAGGLILAVTTKSDPSARYRAIWGVAILSAIGAAASDFAPVLVAPFFALVIVAYFAGNFKTLSGVAAGIKKQAGINPQKGTA